MSKKKRISIAVITVVVVGAAVGAGIVLIHNHRKPKPIPYKPVRPPVADINRGKIPTPPVTSVLNVEITSTGFLPKTFTTHVGTTVNWGNASGSIQTVIESDSKAGPKSDVLGNYQTYEYTFKTAGVYKYQSTLNPDFTGTITVTK